MMTLFPSKMVERQQHEILQYFRKLSLRPHLSSHVMCVRSHETTMEGKELTSPRLTDRDTDIERKTHRPSTQFSTQTHRFGTEYHSHSQLTYPLDCFSAFPSPHLSPSQDPVYILHRHRLTQPTLFRNVCQRVEDSFSSSREEKSQE
jgi:hypothetical protein